MHSGTALIDPYKIFEKISLAPGMRVADLGCGRTGHFVFPASKVVGDKGIVYAVEIVKNILESLKNRTRSEGYGNVHTVWSNIELFGKTPIAGDSLDACFVTNVLYMVKDKLATIKESARLLHPGGFLSIVDWVKKLGPLGPEEKSLVKPEELMNFAKQAGLTLVENFSLSDYHFCLIFKKI